jgi:hypothetical protein
MLPARRTLFCRSFHVSVCTREVKNIASVATHQAVSWARISVLDFPISTRLLDLNGLTRQRLYFLSIHLQVASLTVSLSVARTLQWATRGTVCACNRSCGRSTSGNLRFPMIHCNRRRAGVPRFPYGINFRGSGESDCGHCLFPRQMQSATLAVSLTIASPDSSIRPRKPSGSHQSG